MVEAAITPDAAHNHSTGGDSSAVRRWIKTGALALFGLVCGMLLAEALLVLAVPQLHRRPRVWQFDSELGWGHVPGSHGRLVSPEFDVEYRINQRGLRDSETHPSGAPGKRLLLLGDSFAEGWGVDIEQAVSEQLEERLSDGGIPGEVFNLGVAGYGTDQQLLLFQRLWRAYSPDIVLLLFYGNDLWNNALNRGIGIERGYKPRFVLGPGNGLRLTGVPVRRTRYWDLDGDLPMDQRVSRYAYENWHLAVLLRKAFAPEVPAAQRREFYLALYGTGPDSDRFEKAWKITERLLLEFDTEVRRADAELLLVYVPAIVQIEREDWQAKVSQYGMLEEEYALDKPNRRLAAAAADHGIPFLDLSPAFLAAAVTETLFHRDSHWNAAGHALAADTIAEFLHRQSWLR